MRKLRLHETARFVARCALLLPATLLSSCEPAREAPRVERPLVVDAQGLVDFTTDLGFVVTLSEARMVVRDFQFATGGELHAVTSERTWTEFFVRAAYAHPGHYDGGEVLGEARGRFLVDWLDEDGAELGTATLVVGNYSSANFTFASAEVGDGLGADDALVGHTAAFSGIARQDGQEVAFQFLLDAPSDRLLVGAPFDVTLAAEDDVEVGFEFLPKDELGDRTLLDGIDFALLDADDDGRITVGPGSSEAAELDAYNQLWRTYLTHNHYGFAVRPGSHAAGGNGGSR